MAANDNPFLLNQELYIGNSSVNIFANSITLKVSEGLTLLDRLTGSNIGDMTENGGLSAAFDGDANATFYTASVKSNTVSAYVGKTLAAPSAIIKAVIYAPQLVGYSSSPEVTAKLYVKTGSAPANSADGTLVGELSVVDANDANPQEIVSNNQIDLWEHVWVTTEPTESPAYMHVGEVEFFGYPGTSVVINSTCLVIGNSSVNCVVNSTFTGGGGVGIDGGALQANMVTNAFDTTSIYTAFLVGDLTPESTASAGGLYSIVRKNRANEPFVALSGWDNGSSRDLYYGGGGWQVPDAMTHRFYVANTYTEDNDTGWLRLYITPTATTTYAPGNLNAYLSINTTSVSIVGHPLSVGNSSANVVANTTQFRITNATSYTYATARQFGGVAGDNWCVYGPNDIELGDAVKTVFLSSTSGLYVTADASGQLMWANTSVGFGIGNSTVNTVTNSTSIKVGSNVIVTTADLLIGNSTVNVVANSMVIKLANSTSNTYIAVPNTTAYAGDYFLHANGTWAEIAGASAGGSNTHIQYNDSGAIGGSAGFTFNETTNTVTIANTLAIGANVSLTTTDIRIGNTTVNGAANSIFIGVSNSSGTANLTPMDLTIGNTIVNSTMVQVTGTVNAVSMYANSFSGVPYSSTANGYTRLFNGLIFQWGWVLANSSVGNITLPTTFTYEIFSYSVVGATTDVIYVTSANNTTMNVRSANVGTGHTIKWTAIGY